MTGIELLLACAPEVAPQTTQQIIQVESRGNPLAINVNKGRLASAPRDAADAARLAKKYIAQGYSVDLGLMQINSANVQRLGYRIEDMFEPCKNIAAGARVLTGFYTNARLKYADGQPALQAALSAYNSGSFSRGLSNGYLARYGIADPPGTVPAPTLIGAPAPDPYSTETAVFVRRLQRQTATGSPAENPQAAQQQPQRGQAPPGAGQSGGPANAPGAQPKPAPGQTGRRGAFGKTAVNPSNAQKPDAPLAVANDAAATAIVIGRKRLQLGDRHQGREPNAGALAPTAQALQTGDPPGP